MKTYVVLLRGINVGGHRKIPMALLKSLITELGGQNIQTYIQSGNIILDSKATPEALSNNIEQQIFKTFGYDIPTTVLTREEFEWCCYNNPFLNSEIDFKELHVTFLNRVPDDIKTSDLKNMPRHKNDRYKLLRNLIFLHTPDGYAKTKFSNQKLEKVLSCKATTRNWKTVMKLLDMMG